MTIKLIVVPGTFGREGNLGLLQNIVDLLQPGTFTVETVPYPASMLYPCSYSRSLAVGIARLTTRLQTLERQGEEYAILGYSQGAEVAARTLARHPQRYTNLRGAVLLASPVRLTKASRSGILGEINEHIPEWMQNRILEVANPADIVAYNDKGSIVSRFAQIITHIGGKNYRHQDETPKNPSRKAKVRDKLTFSLRQVVMRHPGLSAHIAYDKTVPMGGTAPYTQIAATFMTQFLNPATI